MFETDAIRFHRGNFYNGNMHPGDYHENICRARREVEEAMKAEADKQKQAEENDGAAQVYDPLLEAHLAEQEQIKEIAWEEDLLRQEKIRQDSAKSEGLRAQERLRQEFVQEQAEQPQTQPKAAEKRQTAPVPPQEQPQRRGFAGLDARIQQGIAEKAKPKSAERSPDTQVSISTSDQAPGNVAAEKPVFAEHTKTLYERDSLAMRRGVDEWLKRGAAVREHQDPPHLAIRGAKDERLLDHGNRIDMPAQSDNLAAVKLSLDAMRGRGVENVNARLPLLNQEQRDEAYKYAFDRGFQSVTGFEESGSARKAVEAKRDAKQAQEDIKDLAHARPPEVEQVKAESQHDRAEAQQRHDMQRDQVYDRALELNGFPYNSAGEFTAKPSQNAESQAAYRNIGFFRVANEQVTQATKAKPEVEKFQQAAPEAQPLDSAKDSRGKADGLLGRVQCGQDERLKAAESRGSSFTSDSAKAQQRLQRLEQRRQQQAQQEQRQNQAGHHA